MIGVAASSTGSSTLQIIATSVTALGVILAFGGLMHTINLDPAVGAGERGLQ